MKKSKFKLGFIVVGILAAMFFAIMPSLAIAGASGPEGLGGMCNDSETMTYVKSGGPVFMGTINVKYEESATSVYVSGSISKQGGGSCKITFKDIHGTGDPWALYRNDVYPIDWNNIKDNKGGAMRGLRLGTDTTQDLDPGYCIFDTGNGPCFEILGVGHFNLLGDNEFSALFILMPLE